MTDDVRYAIEVFEEPLVSANFARNVLISRGRILASEVRRLQSLACEPCETCAHADQPMPGLCEITAVGTKAGPITDKAYAAFGGGCRAHRPRSR